MSGISESDKFCTLFINNINYKSTDESLKSHFEQWGEIVHCNIVRDRNTGQSKGFGFVTYRCTSMLDDAQAARPHKIDGRVVNTRRSFPRALLRKPGILATVNIIYINGLTEDFREEDLHEYFSPYGNIVSVNIIKDKDTGKNKGFAFVEFDDYDPVDKIMLHSHAIKGRNIDVRKSVSREKKNVEIKKEMEDLSRDQETLRADEEFQIGGYSGEYEQGYGECNWQDCYGNGYLIGPVNIIYINGLTEDFREEDLHEYFSPYGNIVSVNIVKDKDTGKNKGFAFVEFDDYDPVDKIMLRSHAIKGRNIDVRKAVSREKKNVEIKKEMEDLSRDQETLRAAEGFHIGGYSGEYEQGYGEGNWQDCYGNNYLIGPDGYLQDCYGNTYLIATEGFENLGYSNIYQNGIGDGAWGANYISCYDGTPVQGNTDYAERNQGYNDYGQGVYGQP